MSDTFDPAELHTQAVTMLDHIRRQEQTVALSKVRTLLLAEQHGLPISQMAEAIGMSDSGVRRLIARAKSGPTEADGATA